MSVKMPVKSHRILDPLYGYVEFNDVEKLVMDNPFVQRLRRIVQTQQTQLVYPSLTHTRFSHSLGVMYLMGNAFDILYPQLINKLVDASDLDDLDDSFRDSIRIGVRIGSLLHDVGHVTLSHWLEPFIKKWAESQQPTDQQSTDRPIIFRDHEELGYYLSKYVILPDFYRRLSENGNWKEYLDPTYVCFVAESMLYPPEKLKQEVDNEYGNFLFNNVLDYYVNVILKDLAKDYNINLETGRGRILRALVFPFYQLLHLWVFTLDEVDYLTRDNLVAGTEFGQIDWMRLLKFTYILPAEFDNNVKSLYLNIDIEKVRHNLKLFYESYFHTYNFVYGHAVVKFFDNLAASLLEDSNNLKKNFSNLLKEVSDLLGEISKHKHTSTTTDRLENIKRSVNRIQLFIKLSELVDATFMQQVIKEYANSIQLSGLEREELPDEQTRQLNKIQQYISRQPNYKVVYRLIALPKDNKVLKNLNAANIQWKDFISKLNGKLKNKFDKDSFILYDLNFRSSKGVRYLPSDTIIDRNNNWDFESFLGDIAQEFNGYCFWTALLYLKKDTLSKKKEIRDIVRKFRGPPLLRLRRYEY